MRALTAFLIYCAAAVAQIRGQYVPGRALNTLTQTGIPFIHAVLAPVSGDSRPQTIVADDRGEFLFRNVKPGAYTLACLSRDYIPSASGRQTPVQIAANQPPPRLECGMTPLPHLTGRVLDAEGNPVPGARGELLDPATRQGSVLTGGKGAFDWPLRPGNYLLFAEAPDGLRAPPADPATGRAQVWARTYYPGTRFREGAQKISLRFGENPPAIELKLAPSPAFMIRGRVLTDFGRLLRETGVALTQDWGPMDWDSNESGRRAANPNAPRVIRTELHSDGSFEFGPVAEGEWRILAADERRAADRWIEVRGADVDDLRLRMAAGFLLRVVGSGRGHGIRGSGELPEFTPDVMLVPHAGPSGEPIGLANWMLLPDMAAPQPEAGSSVAESGAADLRRRLLADEGAIQLSAPGGNKETGVPGRVFAGIYRVTVAPPPEPWYVDSIQVGAIDVASAESDIAPGTGQVTVLYGNHGGAVEGKATNCAGGFVVLVPREPARQWPGFLHSVWCDSADRYRIGSVRPGEYTAIALTGAAPPVLDPEVLKQGVEVTVGVGQTASMDLIAVQPF